MCNKALDYALACEPISDEEAFRRYGYPEECEECTMPQDELLDAAEDPRAGWSDEANLSFDLHIIDLVTGEDQAARDDGREQKVVRLDEYRTRGPQATVRWREHPMQSGYG